MRSGSYITFGAIFIRISRRVKNRNRLGNLQDGALLRWQETFFTQTYILFTQIKKHCARLRCCIISMSRCSLYVTQNIITLPDGNIPAWKRCAKLWVVDKRFCRLERRECSTPPPTFLFRRLMGEVKLRILSDITVPEYNDPGDNAPVEGF